MYGANEVSILTGRSKSGAYEFIKKLQELFKNENPNRVIINGRIPISFFNRMVLGIESNESQIKK